MKLKSKFSLIALVATIQMILLICGAFFAMTFLSRLTNFQDLEQSVQFGLSDITNFLNQTTSWGIDPTTISTEWQNKVVGTNKKFHELKNSPAIKLFPPEFQEDVQNAIKIWTMVVGQINPFNSQFKTMQNIKFSDDVLSYIKRAGIISAHERYPGDENVELLYSQQLLIHGKMRDIIKEEGELGVVLERMTKMVQEQVLKIRYLLYWIETIIGLAFAVILFVMIIAGTEVVRKNILKVRDFSSELAEKNFRNSLTPSGSSEMQALINNMNGMVKAVNDFFVIVKQSAAKAISSGYSINDSATSTAIATSEINKNIESITTEFEQIELSVSKTVDAIAEINRQVEILVQDNSEQTTAIDDSSTSISSMASALQSIKENAFERTKNAEEMKNLVADGDEKIASTTEILESVMAQLDEIAEIITIIDSISEQTNLLSMNAAIESAHAGEYGKGFAVVAEEIRTLAESTAINAQKINESITNVINKVTEANESSQSAAKAFSKVSSHSIAVIDSFREITTGIETLDNQTKQITQKTDVTAATADKINGYCNNLASQQQTISVEISSINELFKHALEEIKEIQLGAEDIVQRMDAVGSLSKESYRNMSDLENVLEEFKTASDDDEEVQRKVQENLIENILSPELKAQLEADFDDYGNSDE